MSINAGNINRSIVTERFGLTVSESKTFDSLICKSASINHFEDKVFHFFLSMIQPSLESQAARLLVNKINGEKKRGLARTLVHRCIKEERFQIKASKNILIVIESLGARVRETTIDDELERYECSLCSDFGIPCLIKESKIFPSSDP